MNAKFDPGLGSVSSVRTRQVKRGQQMVKIVCVEQGDVGNDGTSATAPVEQDTQQDQQISH